MSKRNRGRLTIYGPTGQEHEARAVDGIRMMDAAAGINAIPVGVCVHLERLRDGTIRTTYLELPRHVIDANAVLRVEPDVPQVALSKIDRTLTEGMIEERWPWK